jgi:pyridoxine 5-phosphate synthase
MRLGVNIDHIATLRQQRKEGHPNLVEASKWAINAGADNITIHLREDRRHIQDKDVFELKPVANELNFECATSKEIIDIAIKIRPEWVCIVPEKREELTTEGGLNLSGNNNLLSETIKRLQDNGILVSLFINPSISDIETSTLLGTNGVEIHTGIYSLASNKESALNDIKKCAILANQYKLKVQAGHGLNYNNIHGITTIPEIIEVNIGHSIICKSIEVGLFNAVQEMKQLITN